RFPAMKAGRASPRQSFARCPLRGCQRCVERTCHSVHSCFRREMCNPPISSRHASSNAIETAWLDCGIVGPTWLYIFWHLLNGICPVLNGCWRSAPAPPGGKGPSLPCLGLPDVACLVL